MSCSSRYAEAWEYAAFWCLSSVLIGAHVGGAGDTDLHDPQVNFVNHGARGGVGQIVYNLTQNTSGVITAVPSSDYMTVEGVTWDNGDTYRATFLTASQRAQVEHNLQVVAGDISAALASVGACDCALSAWGARYLAEINIILARLMYDCPCSSQMSDRQREGLSMTVQERLNKIASGELDVCSGATSSQMPVIGWSEIAWTGRNAAVILSRDET